MLKSYRSSQFPQISTVRNVLNMLPNVDSQEEFVVELIKSLNAMIEPKDRNKFSNTVNLFSLNM